MERLKAGQKHGLSTRDPPKKSLNHEAFKAFVGKQPKTVFSIFFPSIVISFFTKATSPSENFGVWYHSCGYPIYIAHQKLTFEV